MTHRSGITQGAALCGRSGPRGLLARTQARAARAVRADEPPPDRGARTGAGARSAPQRARRRPARGPARHPGGGQPGDRADPARPPTSATGSARGRSRRWIARCSATSRACRWCASRSGARRARSSTPTTRDHRPPLRARDGAAGGADGRRLLRREQPALRRGRARPALREAVRGLCAAAPGPGGPDRRSLRALHALRAGGGASRHRGTPCRAGPARRAGRAVAVPLPDRGGGLAAAAPPGRREQAAALHDPVTDLPNRTLFRDRLRQALLAAQRDRGWPPSC